MGHRLESIIRFIVGRLLPKWGYPVLLGPLKGARFILGSLAGEGGGSKVYVNLVEPEKTTTFRSILKSGQVCFDVGANVGYFTILGSRCVGPSGKVIAIEPAMRNLAFLYRHMNLNRLENVTVISAACSDADSLVGFIEGENCALGHITSLVRSERANPEKVTLVPTVKVDTIVERLGILPDLIKIDVEGAELSVLIGARATLRKTKPKILVEIHSDELLTSCRAFLDDLGYSFTPVVPDMALPADFLAQYVEG